MYFFLDDRAKRLQALMKHSEQGITRFKNEVNNELAKKNPNQIASKAKETGRKLGESLRSYKNNAEKLELATKSVSGLLSSFFLPWSSEYELREETGKHLAKAENRFSKLTNLAYKMIRPRR